MKFLQNNWILLIIVFIAGFLRLYLLSSIPGSLNQDETALGYNAYALMKTGADEHGAFLPLALQSFGDWKLPGYPVIAILPIAIFGLNEFAVRLPSAMAGIIGTVLIYYVSLLLFNKKKLALVTTFFFAISPWDIYFSRIAYEVHVATVLFLGGILAFLLFLYGKKHNSKLLLVSALLFSLTMFIYHAFIIFMPIFSVFLAYYYKNYFVKNRVALLAGACILFFSILSILATLHNSGHKLSSLSIWNDENILFHRVDLFRTDNAKDNVLLQHLLYTRYFGMAYQFGQNYIASFSPSFLFDKGGEKLLNSLGYFGNFYLIDVLFLILGFGYLFWNKEKNLVFLFGWLLLAPIPSAITKDAPSATRLFVMLPALVLIASYGFYYACCYIKKQNMLYKCAGILVGGVFLVNIIFFMDAYYAHINYQRALYLHYGYKQVVLLSQKYPGYTIVMRGPENFPYISFLFYTKYDPLQFRKEVVYYPDSHSEFKDVKSFGRYRFVDDIPYDNMQPKTLYIDDRGIRKEDLTISLPSGEPLFKYFVK